MCEDKKLVQIRIHRGLLNVEKLPKDVILKVYDYDVTNAPHVDFDEQGRQCTISIFEALEDV